MNREPKVLFLDGATGSAMPGMGVLFVHELKDHAETGDCPAAMKRDWYTLAAWIGHTEGPLTEEELKKVKDAWSSYLAIGVAPSARLQEAFNGIASELAEKKGAIPPREILSVFDRMLATDDEIRIKKIADLKRGHEKLAELAAGMEMRESPSPRIRFAPRQVIFFSVVWAILVFGYAWLFDPFDEGGWDYLDDQHINRLIAIALLPPFLILLLKIYRKWVQ